MRTLVVEDEEAQRTNLVDELEKLGHRVTAAGDANAGLVAHLRDPFDLLIVDWVLPGMSGLELCKRVRALPGGENPIILVVTGRDRPSDLAKVLDAGADDYLAKPIERPLLTTRVRIAERRIASNARHRSAREALAQSELDFRRVIERTPLGVVALREGQIVYGNPATARLLGFDRPSDLVGRTLLDVAMPEHRELLARHIDAFVATEVPPPPVEVDLVCRDGGAINVRVIPAARAAFAGRRATFVMFEDVTERRATERERARMIASLHKADRLASVGSLAAGVAHEINNPLAYVLANLELIGEDLQKLGEPVLDSVGDQIHGTLRDAMDGAQRVKRIVRDLKNFARTGDEQTASMDVHKVLNAAIDIAANEIRHRATLVRNYGSAPPVRANEGRLTQVFLNLLVNAAHALSEDEAGDNTITVTTGADRYGRVAIEISDTGSGIAAEVLDHIFDPFFTTKPQGLGTGLGLSICHGIVTSLGGEVTVDSEPGRGTTFTVALPAAQLEVAPSPDDVARAKPEGPSRQLKILVVDDEPIICDGIRRALSGHAVDIARNGREAIELCEAQDFDLILCDVMMPEVSGMDVYGRVRSVRPGVETRFVFMTGGAFTPKARAFLESVDNEHIEKPFTLRELRTLVRKRASGA